MAYEERIEVVSEDAGADLSDWNANKFTVVKLNASGKVVPVTAIGDNPFGVLQNDPKLDQAARVAVGGVSKVRCGGTVAAGDKVASNTTAKVVTATVGSRPIGTSLEAGVNGQIISVALSAVNNAPVQA